MNGATVVFRPKSLQKEAWERILNTEYIRQFLKAKKRTLLIALILFLLIAAIKFGAPESYQGSRYGFLLDLSLYLLIPLNVIRDWLDFGKTQKSREIED